MRVVTLPRCCSLVVAPLAGASLLPCLLPRIAASMSSRRIWIGWGWDSAFFHARLLPSPSSLPSPTDVKIKKDKTFTKFKLRLSRVSRERQCGRDYDLGSTGDWKRTSGAQWRACMAASVRGISVLIPAARLIEDVRRAYLATSPLHRMALPTACPRDASHGRSCTPTAAVAWRSCARRSEAAASTE
jgi:hypothetical protein